MTLEAMEIEVVELIKRPEEESIKSAVNRVCG